VYVLVNLQVSNSSDSAASASQMLSSYDSLSSELDKANMGAKALLDSRKYVPLSSFSTTFFGLENEDITLSQISLSRVKDGVGPVQLSGKAVTRQSLASFRDALLALPEVESVDLPISNLAKDKDISFTLTIKIKNS
jgi:hypothetical protein